MPGDAHASAAAASADGWTTALAAALNHLLGNASWARTRLAPHAGRTVLFRFAPCAVSLTITGWGTVAAAAPQSDSDASFKLPPALALRVLAGDPDAWREVEMTGEPALARDLLFVVQNLRWDAEEDLSRFVGDIAARRLVQSALTVRRWHGDLLNNFMRSAAAYVTEEQPLVASRHDIERFARDVDTLRDDVARIEKRIERLTASSR